MKENNPKQTIGGAIRGIISSVIFQLATRVISFIANVIIIRSVSEEVTGFFHVHLQLVMDIVFFLSREVIRRTTMRRFSDDLQKATSISVLTIIIGIVVEILLIPIFYFKAPSITFALPSSHIHILRENSS